MHIIGKYLRLRRELLEPEPRGPEIAMRRRRVAQDMAVTAAALVSDLPDRVPFLDTMPWSDTLGMAYEPDSASRIAEDSSARSSLGYDIGPSPSH